MDEKIEIIEKRELGRIRREFIPAEHIEHLVDRILGQYTNKYERWIEIRLVKGGRNECGDG